MKVTLGVVSALAVGGTVELHFPDEEPPTAAAVVDAFVAQRPVLATVVRDRQGALAPFVNVFVGGENVKRLGRLAARLPAGSEVWVVPSRSGG